ncbi:recombinase family protein [Halobacillus salinarum]|uniref:Recombinase family protein n=1 Tax=Halobacillus salinarum TaxID=2932257 RepID=A0ABY4EKA8_9BACI|nr:recombinase family protein [Halobacillus salinarum]UOQ44069.1 recombinase family protein [Halobacillus salinarum]
MKKKLIVVYSRVSTGSQNLREQIDASNKAIHARNINKDDVLYLEDFNVSATKNDINNRPALKKLCSLVAENKVKLIFIYARDRHSRDFYEGAKFNDLINKHNVEVIYTASNEIPFNKNSSIESFYGIFSQQGGKNIGKRSSDGLKRYPGETIGYKRKEENIEGERRKVTFIKDGKRSKVIQHLFEEFSQIKNKEEFVSILKNYGKKLNSHSTVIKILQRPFYAAYCITDYGYDPLNHVEAIISLDLFKKAQTVLNQFIKEYEYAVLRAQEKILAIPTCGVCNKQMKFMKPLGSSAYFVCSAGHKKIDIELDQLNHVIHETILNETKQFALAKYKPIFRTHFNGTLDNLVHQKKHQELILNRNVLSITSQNFVKVDSNFKKLEQQIRNNEYKINAIEKEIVLLQSLKNEIDTLTELADKAVSKLSDTDVTSLIELLIKKILIHHEFLEINMYSLTFDKGAV